MKSNQFVYIKPKNSEAREVFESDMRGLHSCKILRKSGSDLFVKSIAGDYYFQIDTDKDNNWELIK